MPMYVPMGQLVCVFPQFFNWVLQDVSLLPRMLLSQSFGLEPICTGPLLWKTRPLCGIWRMCMEDPPQVEQREAIGLLKRIWYRTPQNSSACPPHPLEVLEDSGCSKRVGMNEVTLRFTSQMGRRFKQTPIWVCAEHSRIVPLL